MVNPTILDPFVETTVEAFELASAAHPETRMESFLPPKNHDKYLMTVSELIRVELDLAWSGGKRLMLAEFQTRFPELFEDNACREQLAFEEFRLRRLAGDSVSVDEYQERLQVDTASWSSWLGYDESDSVQPAEPVQNASTLARGSTTADYPAEAPVESLQPGVEWNGFEIVRSLGKGSFGQTFLARQRALGDRDVVLKFSNFDCAEAQKLARLQHTNITPVFSVHRCSSGSVMCMPFLGSCTLANLTAELVEGGIPASGASILEVVEDRTPKFTASAQASEARRFFSDHSYTRSVLWITARLADGLQHSHERGILHRDVKPANILVREDGEPLLIDFNLAADRSRNVDATTGGTLPYMSPQQIHTYLHGETDEFHSSFDSGSDVYSLGVCLYQLLTGRLPHDDDRRETRLDEQSLQSRRKKPERLSLYNPDTTPAVQAIVDRCLAFDPAVRYATAAQLRDDLLRHLDDRPLRYARNDSLREGIAKWIRRNPALFSFSTAFTVLAIAALLMFGAWSVRQHQLFAVSAENALHHLQGGLEELSPALAAVGMPSVDADPISESAVLLAESMGVAKGPAKNLHREYLSESQQAQWRESACTLSFLLAKSNAYAAQRAADPVIRDQRFHHALAWSDVADMWANKDKALVIDWQRQRVKASMSGEAGTPNDAPSIDFSKAQGQDAVESLFIGMEQYEAHDLVGATESFRRATQLAPHDPTGWLRLADVLMLQNENASALACFDICSILLPDCDVVHFQRGLCYLQDEQPERAIADFTRTIEMRPQLEAAWLNRALAHLARGARFDALNDLNRIIDQGAANPRAFFIRSRLLKEMGEVTESLADQNRGLRVQPTDDLGWIARGIAWLPEHPEKALEDFQQALRSNPRNNAARHNMAHVYSERLQMPEKALQSLDESLEFDASDDFARAGRGVLLSRLGRTKAALADARQLLENDIDAITRYQVACIFAVAAKSSKNRAKQAIHVLLDSLTEDMQLLDIVGKDPDLENLRAFDEYQQGVANLESLRVLIKNTSARDRP